MSSRALVHDLTSNLDFWVPTCPPTSQVGMQVGAQVGAQVGHEVEYMKPPNALMSNASVLTSWRRVLYSEQTMSLLGQQMLQIHR
jgi:hypothetical protein